MELQEVISEIENSKQISSSVSSLINDTSQYFSTLSDMFLVSILGAFLEYYYSLILVQLKDFPLGLISCDNIQDLKTMIYQCSAQQKLIINDHEELNSQMLQKVSKIENEKVCIFDVCGNNPSASSKASFNCFLYGCIASSSKLHG